ncbi:MAG: hypothetical protein NW224_24825 [Leptolyngbyaceae cyanobacterium bins.302]|nr:hypothetical protein [Leptolyngbyaceae cyanobacterium bins.302]
MSSLYQLISNIERRPSMYLGKPYISNLRSFLAGYIFARRELNQPQTVEEKEFSDFQTWIKSKYRISSDQSWDRIILFFCEDESRALLEFFKLFNEFSSSSSEPIQAQAPVRRSVDAASINPSEKAIDTLS